MNNFPVGQGMVEMDWCVTAALWLAAVVAVLVSVKLGGQESVRALRYRWVMSLGFLLLAATLTLRLLQWGDLPMSPQYAVGLLLVCFGYIALAIDRLRS